MDQITTIEVDALGAAANRATSINTSAFFARSARVDNYSNLYWQIGPIDFVPPYTAGFVLPLNGGQTLAIIDQAPPGSAQPSIVDTNGRLIVTVYDYPQAQVQGYPVNGPSSLNFAHTIAPDLLTHAIFVGLNEIVELLLKADATNATPIQFSTDGGVTYNLWLYPGEGIVIVRRYTGADLRYQAQTVGDAFVVGSRREF